MSSTSRSRALDTDSAAAWRRSILVLALNAIGLSYLFDRVDFPDLWFWLSVALAVNMYLLGPVFSEISRRTNPFSRQMPRPVDILCDLLKLPSECAVFERAIVPGSGPVDFVVVDSGTVYTIWLKPHGGIIEFDGAYLTQNSKGFKDRNILQISVDTALALRGDFSDSIRAFVPVKPVLVFANTAIMNFGPYPFQSCFLVRRRDLFKVFSDPDPTLAAMQVAIVSRLEEIGERVR